MPTVPSIPRDLLDLKARLEESGLTPDQRALIQKLLNAGHRILEFDAQIDGPTKLALALADSDSVRIAISRARSHLIRRRYEMSQFLILNGCNVPTFGI